MNSLTYCVNFAITTNFFLVKTFPNKTIVIIIQDICLHCWHTQFTFGLKAISGMCSHFLWNHSKHTLHFTIYTSKSSPSKLDQLILRLYYKFRSIVFSLFFRSFLDDNGNGAVCLSYEQYILFFFLNISMRNRDGKWLNINY